MFLLKLLMRNRGGPAMDPLQVSMTGVRMGERFLQIGCSDKALLAGLSSKVGLSGTAAVATLDTRQAELAESIGRKAGTLIDVKTVTAGGAWPFDAAAFDMVVIDDTRDAFATLTSLPELLSHALDSLRVGGRIEVVTPIKSAHPQFDHAQALTRAGFQPVRLLAESGTLRFIEGLKRG